MSPCYIQPLNIPSIPDLTGFWCYSGTGSPLVKPGDQICIVPTVQTPLVIRPIPDRSRMFHVVGSCYVHGMMYGEVLERLQQASKSVQMTTVVFV
jgi:hypothetical protein